MRCKTCLDANPLENEMRNKRNQLRVDLAQLKGDGDKIKVNIDSQVRS